MSLGDSKTSAGLWQADLIAGLTATERDLPWAVGNYGQSGATVATYLAATPWATVPVQPPTPPADAPVSWGVLNLGTNDVYFGLPSQVTWETNYLAILDAVHAKWPNARWLISKPWLRGFDAQADTLAGWIDNVIAARSFAAAGVDERIVLKGSDNGATELGADGIHPSALGYQLYANAVQSAMGY